MPRPFVPLLLLLAVPALVCADAASFDADRGEAVRLLIEDLEKVAQWCRTTRLFGKRDETCELILAFDPDHVLARKTLKFETGADGAWVQDARYKRPRDWKPDSIPRYEERLRAALVAYRDRMLDACLREVARDGHGRAADAQVELLGRLPGDAHVLAALKATLLAHHAKLQEVEVPVALERVSARLHRHFPDDADVRRALGEVQVDGRWILPATVKALAAQDEIAARAAAALEAAPEVTTTEASEAERAAGGASRGVKTTPHLRVVGTTSEASLIDIARHGEAAGPFLEALVGREIERTPTRTLFVFNAWEHWTNFVDRFPGLSPEVRAHARAAKSSGYPLTTTAYACLPVGRREVELDVCVDVIFQTLLNEAFAVWHEARQQWQELPGWVRIGVSDYLTFRLTGKRILTTVGGETGYGEETADVGDRSPKAGTDLLPIALAALKRNQAPGTHLMLGKKLVAFTRDDAVTSFAFARYLLEGRRDAAVRILTEVGKGRDTKTVVQQVLRMSVEALHVELVRWIEEMIAAAK